MFDEPTIGYRLGEFTPSEGWQERAKDPAYIDLEAKLRAWTAQRGTTLRQYLEKMAAAYYLQTGIPPDQCVLVHETKYEDGKITDTYHFEQASQA